MKKMRITEQDILQEVRLQAGSVIENVDAVILESNGEISVISNIEYNELEDLKSYK